MNNKVSKTRPRAQLLRSIPDLDLHRHDILRGLAARVETAEI